MTDTERPEGIDPPAILCLGTGTYVPYGWRWWKCPECGAAVWRDPETLGLVEHTPGDRGENPEKDAPPLD